MKNKGSKKYVQVNGLNVSIGNLKIGTDTMLINMGSATDCPSAKLGLCKIGLETCYAYKAENVYPVVKPYRDRQEQYWLNHTASEIIQDLRTLLDKRKYQGKILGETVRYFRFNESGDFHSQECVQKLDQIAMFLRNSYGIITYGYTARGDLYFSQVSFVIKSSGYNNCPAGKTTARPANELKEVNGLTIDRVRYIKCPGDCQKCNFCKTAAFNIVFAIH